MSAKQIYNKQDELVKYTLCLVVESAKKRDWVGWYFQKFGQERYL